MILLSICTNISRTTVLLTERDRYTFPNRGQFAFFMSRKTQRQIRESSPPLYTGKLYLASVQFLSSFAIPFHSMHSPLLHYPASSTYPFTYILTHSSYHSTLIILSCHAFTLDIQSRGLGKRCKLPIASRLSPSVKGLLWSRLPKVCFNRRVHCV